MGQGHNVRVETVVLAKVGELGGSVLQLLSSYAMEACVKDESDALKVLLAGVETRFREEHAAVVEAIGEQKAMMNEQTPLLEALCGEVKAVSEEVDPLCSHTGRLGFTEQGVAAKPSRSRPWRRRQTLSPSEV